MYTDIYSTYNSGTKSALQLFGMFGIKNNIISRIGLYNQTEKKIFGVKS